MLGTRNGKYSLDSLTPSLYLSLSVFENLTTPWQAVAREFDNIMLCTRWKWQNVEQVIQYCFQDGEETFSSLKVDRDGNEYLGRKCVQGSIATVAICKMSNNRKEQSGLVFESYEPPGEGPEDPEASIFCHWTWCFNGSQLLLQWHRLAVLRVLQSSCAGNSDHFTVHVQLRLGSSIDFGRGRRTDQGLQSLLQRAKLSSKLQLHVRLLHLLLPAVPVHPNLLNWLQTGTLWSALPGVYKRDQSEVAACIDFLMWATSEGTCFY